MLHTVILLTLLHLLQCLDPDAYGTAGKGLSEAYQAKYRRAREMRELSFAKGSEGPKEEVMQTTYQERYTINIAPRSQSCFFLEDLEDGYVISIHYLVVSDKGGEQMDISMNLKDSNNKMIVFQGRKKEDHFVNHTVTTNGDYELCFNNKYSSFTSKKVMWELDVVGDEEKMNTNEDIVLAVNQTLEAYKEEAKQMRKAVVRVRTQLSKMRTQQWWLGTKTPKDTERLISVTSMIDNWSMAYSIMILMVGFIQVVVLKRLFNVRLPTSNMKMRT